MIKITSTFGNIFDMSEIVAGWLSHSWSRAAGRFPSITVFVSFTCAEWQTEHLKTPWQHDDVQKNVLELSFVAGGNRTARKLWSSAIQLTTVKAVSLPPVLSAKWTSHTVPILQAHMPVMSITRMVCRFLHVPCELSGPGLMIGHTVQCRPGLMQV